MKNMWICIHHHRHGVDVHPFHFIPAQPGTQPSEASAIKELELDFEGDREDEYLEILHIGNDVKTIREQGEVKSALSSQKTKKPTTAEESLMEFIKTVEDTGGVKLDSKGLYEPQADPDWIDLGDAYVNACEVLKRKPMIEEEEEEVEEDGESEES